MNVLKLIESLDSNGFYKEADEATERLAEGKMEDDPCWEGYEMIGTKKKNGKEVPNCVKKKKA